MTSFGFETMKSGAPMTGMRNRDNIPGIAIGPPPDRNNS
jgi:hypothetical protein